VRDPVHTCFQTTEDGYTRVCVCVCVTCEDRSYKFTRTSRPSTLVLPDNRGPVLTSHTHTCLLTTEDRPQTSDTHTHTHTSIAVYDRTGLHLTTSFLLRDLRLASAASYTAGVLDSADAAVRLHLTTSFLLRDLRLASAATYTAGVRLAGIHVLADYQGPSSDVRHTQTHTCFQTTEDRSSQVTHTHTHTHEYSRL